MEGVCPHHSPGTCSPRCPAALSTWQAPEQEGDSRLPWTTASQCPGRLMCGAGVRHTPRHTTVRTHVPFCEGLVTPAFARGRVLCLCAKRETNRPRRRRSPCKLSPTHDVGVFLPPPPPTAAWPLLGGDSFLSRLRPRDGSAACADGWIGRPRARCRGAADCRHSPGLMSSLSPVVWGWENSLLTPVSCLITWTTEEAGNSEHRGAPLYQN